MIGEYNRLLAQSFEIMTVVVHGLDDCQYLLVVDFIIEFRRVELSTPEGYRVEFAGFRVSLRDNTPLGIIGGVRFHNGGQRGVEMSQDGSCCER